MKAELIPAVVYLRMSSDDQTVSIERQEREIRSIPGYRVIRTYRDEGKSGSKDQEKRTDFQRLLIDSDRGDFQAILVYNASRFARLDSIDGAYAKQTLRTNGVYLHTKCEGKIDWATTEGRMFDFMLSEQNHAYSRSLSKDSISGRLRAIEAGQWPYGSIPYGYDRLYRSGSQEHRISRSESFRKPRNWSLFLVENPEEAEVVRRIFDLYVHQAMSRRAISLVLNNEGIPGPDNLPGSQCNGWTSDSIRNLLTHRAYIGIAEMGHGKKTAKEAFGRIPKISKEGVCPVIVDKKLFDDAQDIIAKNRKEGRRQPSGSASWLSGVMVCGHCGYRLAKMQRANAPAYYGCDSAARRPHLGCSQWRVAENEILPAVVQAIVATVDAELLASFAPAKPEAKGSRPKIAGKHVASLKTKIATATRRAATEEDEELAAAFREELRKMREELKDAETSERAASVIQANGFSEWWTGQKEILVGYADGDTGLFMTPRGAEEIVRGGTAPDGRRYTNKRAMTCDRDAFRALLRRLGISVKMFWKPTAKKVGNRRFDVDFARLAIDMTWEDNSEDDPNPAIAGRNGTFCQRVFSIRREITLRINSAPADNGRSCRGTIRAE